MPLYFAYGANMDVDAMAVRCPGSKALGPARLPGHRLAIMREGWLTVARDARGQVHGVLWDLALSDVPTLDRFEDVSDGLYIKVSQPVIAQDGQKPALIYVGANAGPGRANVEYIIAVLESARKWRFPPEGLEAYERLAREAGVELEATPRQDPQQPEDKR